MFKLHRKGSSATEAIEYIVAGASITPGKVLKFNSGKLVIASGTDKPEYVSLGSANTDEILPVKRIYEDEVYETVLQAAGTSLKSGDTVNIHTDGAQATATKGGAFEILEMDGTEVGSKVRGVFKNTAAGA